MLLAIALDLDRTVPEEAETAAIRVLQMRGNADVAVKLSKLLRPHRGWEVRNAAATALTQLPCNGECIAWVLDYLERVHRGEPNWEDRLEFPGLMQRSMKAELQRDQEVLCSRLYSVLRRNKSASLVCLERLYGLGTRAVSTFALDVMSQVDLREGCALLLESQRSADSWPVGNFPRGDIHSTVAALNCQVGGSDKF